MQERNQAAKELFHIVSSDLREVPAEELSTILEHLTKQMLDNVKVCLSGQLKILRCIDLETLFFHLLIHCQNSII